MDISVKGKNLDVDDSMSARVEAQLDFAVTKYCNLIINLAGIVSRKGQDTYTDISVHPRLPGFMIQGNGEAGGHFAAIDSALDRSGQHVIMSQTDHII